MQIVLILLLLIALQAARAASLPKNPGDLSLFTINEFEGDADDLSDAVAVPSQDWVRAWFKWAQAPDFHGKSAVILKAHDLGALFGGGVTCSALYQHENGITEAQFLDMATRDPYGKLYVISNSYYHGSLENPAYQRFVLKWAEQQVDAGVDTLFMDEVNGAYSIHEGYDSYGLKGFRDYLLQRFVKKQKWSIIDKRWMTRFRINLADTEECPDHTVQSFDYGAYLRRNSWADEPDNASNLLSPVWGSPGDITADTYSADRNNRVWRFWASRIRAYARQHHQRVWLAANGLNHFVDYQIAGMYGGFPKNIDGQLSCTGSNIAEWRSDFQRSREMMDGKDVPIMTFHDWGNGMPWMDQLSAAERVAWLQAYAPEVFASGLFFAYPVHGPFGCDSAVNGTLATIQKQARFILTIAPYLHHLSWQNPTIAQYTGKAETTVQAQPAENRMIIHLINRDYDGLVPIVQQNRALQVAMNTKPLSVFIHDADTGMVSKAVWRYNAKSKLHGYTSGGTLSIQTPSLQTWDVIVVNLKKWQPLPDPNSITVSCFQAWSRPFRSQFLITSKTDSYQSLSGLNAFIQGKLHPDLRNNPVFTVMFKRPGTFEVHVNSVSTGGARLLISVDGKQKLAIPLADKDGQNNGNAEEINHTYSVPVEAGMHRISVQNDGDDWFTVDWYRFIGL
jgi:hypothetical protein